MLASRQSSLFTATFATADWQKNGDGSLSEEAIHAGQTSILARQGGLDVFVRGQLCQVSQSCYCWFTAQHLSGHSFNVTGCHIAWKLRLDSVKLFLIYTSI